MPTQATHSRLRFVLSLVLFISLNVGAVKLMADDDSRLHGQDPSVNQLTPLTFTKNEGQWDGRVLFRTVAGGAILWFCRDGIYHEFMKSPSDGETEDRSRLATDKLGSLYSQASNSDSLMTAVVKATFVGASPDAQVFGEGLVEYRCNYFLGNDPSRWRTNVQSYSGVVYRDIYPGIDAHFEVHDGQFRTIWSSSTDADLSQIRIQYEGNAEIYTSDSGITTISLPWGTKVETVITHIEDTSPSTNLRSDSKPFDHSHSVIARAGTESAIALIYSTYIGGSAGDKAFGIAVDSEGKAILTGQTYSNDFPTMTPLQPVRGGGYQDAFVTKMSESGDSLVFSTYFGGASEEYGGAITVASDGSIYVTGLTYSSDFPLLNPLQPAKAGGADVFVTKLDPTGSMLAFSTYLGGCGDEEAFEIPEARDGSVFACGGTTSSDFPVINPVQATNAGDYDAFVFKLEPPGMSLAFSSYFGGSGQDVAVSLAVDTIGDVYMAGSTRSSNFPLMNAFQSTNAGGLDGFVTKLSGGAYDLVYSTYLGGSQTFQDDYDLCSGIAVDDFGNAYVTGVTTSTDFPVVNALQPLKAGYNDAFVTKLSASGSELIYSTYFGGHSTECARAISVSNTGNVCIAGTAYSNDFPWLNAFQGLYAGEGDVFVTKFGVSGTALLFSTYLGGSKWDEGTDLTVDESGVVYVTGGTRSPDFPVANALQDFLVGGYDDVFVSKFGGFWCRDSDGDGYGSSSDCTASPDPPEGYVGNSDDCDDADPAVHPGAMESCNGLDDDCDNQIDENFACCACDCHADPAFCNGIWDVADVLKAIEVAFQAATPILDPNENCPYESTDVDCSGATDVTDVVHTVNVAFRGAEIRIEFCEPCP